VVKKRHDPIDLEQANKRLQDWRKKYDTPEKVAAQYRKKILDWVVESMAFEGEPVSKARLKALLKKEGRLSRSTKKDRG
jgi:hypothetical protein